MTAKHTPGPWSGELLPGGSRMLIMSGERAVAEIHPLGKSVKQAWANFHLILAAPAMLEALKDASPILEHVRAEIDDYGPNKVADAVQEAILLAEKPR